MRSTEKRQMSEEVVHEASQKVEDVTGEAGQPTPVFLLLVGG